MFLQKISEKIQELNVNVHQVRQREKRGRASESYFAMALSKYSEVNCGSDFQEYVAEIRGNSQTFPQILLHSKTLLRLLLRRLKIEAKNSLEPFLSLLDALVRDICSDFLIYLPETLATFKKLIDDGVERDPDMLKLVFTCLARIFKSVRKELSENPSNILESTRLLRLHKSSQVRSLTVQAVALIFRRASLPKIIEVIRSLLQELSFKSGHHPPDKSLEICRSLASELAIKYESAGRLLAESVRGVAHGIYSRANKLIGILLDPDSELIQSESLFKVSEAMFLQICQYGQRGRLDPLWNELFMAFWKNFDAENNVKSMRVVVFHLKLILVMICFRGGSLVENFIPIFEVLEHCIKFVLIKAIQVDIDITFQELLLEIMLGLCDSHNMCVGASAGPEKLALRATGWNRAFKYFSSRLVGKFLERLNQRAKLRQPAALNLLKLFVPVSCEKLIIDKSAIGLAFLSDSCFILFESKYVKRDFLSREIITSEILQLLKNHKIESVCLTMLCGLIRISPFCFEYNKCIGILEVLTNDALDGCENLQKNAGDVLNFSILQAGLESLLLLRRRDYRIYHSSSSFNSYSTLAFRVVKISMSYAGPILCAANLIEFEQDSTGLLEFAAHMNFEGLCSSNRYVRHALLKYLSALNVRKGDESWMTLKDILCKLCDLNSYSLEDSTEILSKLKRYEVALEVVCRKLNSSIIPPTSIMMLTKALLGTLHIKLSPVWNHIISALGILLSKFSDSCEIFISFFEETYMECVSKMDSNCSVDDPVLSQAESRESEAHTFFFSKICPVEIGTNSWIRLNSLLSALSRNSYEGKPKFMQSVSSLLLKFMSKENRSMYSEWKLFRCECIRVLLTSFCGGYFLLGLKESTQIYHFLMEMIEAGDSESACLALQCLGKWEFPYLNKDIISHLQLIANPTQMKNALRNLCFDEKTANLDAAITIINQESRRKIVPLVVQILLPYFQQNSNKYASSAFTWLSDLSSFEILPLMSSILTPFFKLKSSELQILLCKTTLSKIGPIDWLQISDRNCIDFKVQLSLRYFKRLEAIVNFLGDHALAYLYPFISISLAILTKASGICEQERSVNQLPANSHNSKKTPDSALQSYLYLRELKGVKEVRASGLRILAIIVKRYPDFGFNIYCKNLVSLMKPAVLRLLNECNGTRPPPVLQIVQSLSYHEDLVILKNIDKSISILKFAWEVLKSNVASEESQSICLEVIQNLLVAAEMRSEEQANIAKSMLKDYSAELFTSLHQSLEIGNQYFAKGTRSTKKNSNYFRPNNNDKIVMITRLGILLSDINAINAIKSSLISVIKRPRHDEIVISSLLSAFAEIFTQVCAAQTESSVNEYWSTIIPLLGRIQSNCVRSKILDACDSLSRRKDSLKASISILRDLHSTSEGSLSNIDYNTRLKAYEKLDRIWYKDTSSANIRAILFQAFFDLRNSDFALRNGASTAIEQFILLLDQECNTHYSELMGSIILPGIRALLNNSQQSTREMSIAILGFIASKTPHFVPGLAILYKSDPEINFFSNIIHLQSHRRSRALTQLALAAKMSDFEMIDVAEYYLPISLINLIDSAPDVVSAAVTAIQAISAKLSWKSFKDLLRKILFRTSKLTYQKKVYIRTLASVLENLEIFFKRQEEIDFESIFKEFLPKLMDLLPLNCKTGVDAIIFPTTVVAYARIIKYLPEFELKIELNRLLAPLLENLVSRSQSMRDNARKSIKLATGVLGTSSLLFVVEILRTRLTQGFQVHVLSAIIYDILQIATPVLKSDEIDTLLPEVLPILEMDIFGYAAQEKDISSFAATFSEARRTRSIDSFMLIAMHASFPGSVPLLLSPVIRHMGDGRSLEIQKKIEEILCSVQKGILFKAEFQGHEILSSAQSLLLNATAYLDEYKLRNQSDSLYTNFSDSPYDGKQNYQPLVIFALNLIKGVLKQMGSGNFSNKNRHICDEKIEGIIPKIIRLISFPSSSIPSLCLQILAFSSSKMEIIMNERTSDSLTRRLLAILNTLNGSEPRLTNDCLRLCTKLLTRHVHFLPTNAQFRVILGRCFECIENNNDNSSICCSTLRALLARRPLISEIYDGMEKICYLIAGGATEELRKNCAQILLQFLLDYPLGARKVQHYVEYLLISLKYGHSEGRMSIISALHSLILKFPKPILNDTAEVIFLPLVVQMGSDDCILCRKGVGESLIALFKRISSLLKTKFLLWMEKWFIEEKKTELRQTSIQIIGLTLETSPKETLSTIKSIWPSIMSLLESKQIMDSKSWPLLYKTLLLLEKVWYSPECLPFIESKSKEIISLVVDLFTHEHKWIQTSAARLLNVHLKSQENEIFGSRSGSVYSSAFRDITEVIVVLENLILIFEMNYTCSDSYLNLDLLKQVSNNISILVVKYLWENIPHSKPDIGEELKILEGLKFIRKLGRYCVISKNSLREVCIRCIAGILAETKKTILTKYPDILREIILPCYICIDPAIKGVPLLHRQLAVEVLQLTRTLVSENQFNTAYSNIQSKITKRRLQRKSAQSKEVL